MLMLQMVPIVQLKKVKAPNGYAVNGIKKNNWLLG